MLVNLAVIVVLAMVLFWLFERLRLPGLLGMILAGVALGTDARDLAQEHFSEATFQTLSDFVFIHPTLMAVSAELRLAALIVILFRAGLGIQRATLAKVGMPALRMSFIPSLCEGLIVMAASRLLLGLTWVEGGILGFVLAAVSPAVVVPQMLELKDRGLGEAKGVPTLVLAGASIDDVFAITLFGAFLGMATASDTAPSFAWQVAGIPISITTGVALGLGVGYLLVRFFKRFHLRDTRKVLILMAVAIFLTQLQAGRWFPFASLLAIMAIGFIILETYEVLAHRLANKFNKLWVFAELLLFVLIGAEVNVAVLGGSGLVGLAVLAIGLAARSAGVWASLLGADLDRGERLFCVLAYLPKATVQAAIGGIALAQVTAGTITLSDGRSTGDLILAMAVLSIVVTAPIGAIAIRLGAPRLLAESVKPPAA